MRPSRKPEPVVSKRKPPIATYAIEVMAGKMRLEDVPHPWAAAVRSVIQLPVFEEAEQVLTYSTKERRAKALLRIPESIRPLVEAEARRLFVMRKPDG
jgi:hypothetical protein